MDKTSVIGLLFGIIAVGVGMVIKGVSLAALINPAAILIIILGTIAAGLIAFPSSTVRNIPSLFKILFTEKKLGSNQELIQRFASWADIARKEGLLALDDELDSIEDSFLSSGLQFAVDGMEADQIKDILYAKIDAMEQRHEEGASVFAQAGTYAP